MKNLLLYACVILLTSFSKPSSASDWLYRMQPGDTLWDLCIEYTHKRGCWLELASYNKISRDRRIPPGSVIRFPLQWLKTVPQVGTVESVQGDVFYKAAGNQERLLQSGQAVTLGATIRSQEGAASLRLGNSSTVLVRPSTTLKLDQMSSIKQAVDDTELDLKNGNVEASVRKGARARFKIKTPAAIASVRGTRYRVVASAQDKVTRSEVLEGEVRFGAEQVVDVPAGFGVLAQEGKPPVPPRALLPAPELAESTIKMSAPVMFDWPKDVRAIAWQLDVYGAKADSGLLFSRRVTEPSITLPSIESGCYRMVLSAYDEAGFQGLERRFSLCVKQPLVSVSDIDVVLADADGANLQWGMVADAVKYKVVLAADETFENVLWSGESNNTQMQLPSLAGSRIWVKIVAIDQHDNTSNPVITSYATEKTDWRAIVGMTLFVLISLL